ncbi:hypothetical protein AN1V17_09180 [Vallitalea sediminicola]
MTVHIESRQEYINFYKSISAVKKNGDEFILSILPHYGAGKINIINISNYLSIMILDIKLKEDVDITYKLPNQHFEISCCLGGIAQISSINHKTINIEKDSVILLNSSNDSEISGNMKLFKNKKFVNMAFSFDRETYSEYHKVISKELWGEVLTSDKVKKKHTILAERLPHIKILFLSIYNIDIENGSLKKLYIESKILEIITQVAYASCDEQNKIKVNAYEKEQIQRIPDIMMKNPANPPMIDSLAEATNINVNRLKKGFKYLYGDTIYSYFKKLKLHRAAILIQTTDKSMLDIAQDVGYSSQSQFGASFKKYYGVTPLEFSKQKYLL